jgi:deazaflavin-dependent oxidoreductase (nitroreductase family)
VRKRIHDLAMHAVLASLTRGHRALHRASGGRLGRHFPGGQRVIWISTLGRRSGQWRRTPLLAVRDGSAHDDSEPYVVAGSNAGQARVPGWVFNLRAHPAGFLEVDGRHWRVRFEEAAGADRDALYALLVASWSAFEGYARRAERAIPVFRVLLEAPVAGPPGVE